MEPHHTGILSRSESNLDCAATSAANRAGGTLAGHPSVPRVVPGGASLVNYEGCGA